MCAVGSCGLGSFCVCLGRIAADSSSLGHILLGCGLSIIWLEAPAVYNSSGRDRTTMGLRSDQRPDGEGLRRPCQESRPAR